MRVAKTFEGFTYDETKAYENTKGKLVVDAKETCDRCGGSGIAISRVENGQPIPYVNDDGMCYGCMGRGYIFRTIRLYTDEEFAKMEKANERAAAKREQEREDKMQKEFFDKKVKWLLDNGFNAEMTTYVYFPADSYEVKDTLKAAGFRFNSNLMWHVGSVPAGYEEKVISISFDDVCELSAWGEGHYKASAKKFIEDKIKSMQPASKSEWFGKEKDKFSDLSVTLVSVHPYTSKFGYSQVVKFKNEENLIIWFTSVEIPFQPGENLLLSGTIKKLDEYNDVKQTIVTRCKMRGVE